MFERCDDPTTCAEAYGPTGLPIFWARRIMHLVDTDMSRTLTMMIGAVCIVTVCAQMLRFLWGFVRPSTLNIYCHSETGSWALVTGASDGIGKGFAEELLDHGFNVLLHGRSQEKLERIRREFHLRWPKRSVDYVVADAASADHPEAAVVKKVAQSPGKLTVLVNNVGGITFRPQFRTLGSLTPGDVDSVINVNARFPTQLTRALMPTLQANQPTLVLNCGSAGGLSGCPYIGIYTATKSYVHTLTMALKAEMAAEKLQSTMTAGIEVMGFVIGNVRSASNKSEMPFFTMDARDCAKGALARVGSGRALEYASMRQALQIGFLSNLPEWMVQAGLVKEMSKRKAEETAASEKEK